MKNALKRAVLMQMMDKLEKQKSRSKELSDEKARAKEISDNKKKTKN